MLPYAFVAALLAGGGVAAWAAARMGADWKEVVVEAEKIVEGSSSRGFGIPQTEIGRLERRILELVREIRDRETEAEERARRFETILRNMADGVVVLEPDGRISFANAAAITLLGISTLGELLGSRLALVCRNPDLSELLQEVTESGSARTREIVLDGAERTALLVSGAPIDSNTGASGAVLVLHDVTRVRRLESMRADFVANVSHELRTPLTAIRGYAETLLGGALDDSVRAKQFLHVIERHSERLSRLIDDLLTLSDLELGRTEIQREPLDLGDIVRGVLEVLEAKAGTKEITLTAEIPPRLPVVLGDRDRIEQVLINLVDNAIKYTPTGGRVAVMARTAGNGSGESLVIDVSDTGMGIPEKDIPRLTERFYRVDRARSRELGGTGLGLAIVKHIVQAHGGTLEIESRIQRGTMVRVELPGTPPATG